MGILVSIMDALMHWPCLPIAPSCFGLRSASGEVERWRREAPSGTQPERNAAAEPQTEARRACGTLQMRHP